MRLKITLFLLLFMVMGAFIWLKARNYDYVKMAATRLESPAKPITYKTLGEIPPPKGFVRTTEGAASFGSYLRSLPLKLGENKVYLYNGTEKSNQSAHFAVVDMDTGDKDLQQCADVTMRLWAEYLYKYKRYNEIKFNFLGDGKPRHYKDYAKGDYSYPKFRKYLEWIFAYANTASLYKELKTVSVDELKVGDVFIFTGVPYGHAVIVVDMAHKPETGEKVFMLVQGWIPAQDMQLLRNPSDGALSPWYSADFGDKLITPEFVFSKENNYRIKRYGE